MNNLDYWDLETTDTFVLFKKVSDKDKYNFYEYLSVMLNSGVWMWETLNWVSEKLDNVFFQTKNKWNTCVYFKLRFSF